MTPPPVPAPLEEKRPGSLVSAMNWMGCLSLLLFWLPVVGPFVAGFLGGRRAGTIGRAIAAVFLPAVLTGLMIGAGITYLVEAFWGVLAGVGFTVWSLLTIGPMLLGALAGGVVAEIEWRRRLR